jgi:hypothetical protein
MFSAFVTSTNKLVITHRTWSDAGPSETKYWIAPEDADFDQAMEWCKAKGLL